MSQWSRAAFGGAMQVEGTRVYRVKAVAEMLDVSAATIYRAVQAGELDAYKLGRGKGAALRIPADSLAIWLDGCGEAAYEAYVEGGADPATDDELTSAQADGLACIVCGADYLERNTPHRPVGHSHTGSQVFACTEHDDQAARGGVELAGDALHTAAGGGVR